MHLILDKMTALEFWRSNLARRDLRNYATNRRFTSFSDMSPRELAARLDRIDGAQGTLSLLVEGRGDRRWHEGIELTAWGDYGMPTNSIIELSDEVSVLCPELSLVRVAPQLTDLELLRAVFDLCGIYARDFDATTDLTSREPVTDVQSVADYCAALGGRWGVRKVKRCLAHAVERCASPREVSLAMCLALPTRSGGQGLPRFEANAPIALTDQASSLTPRNFLVGDIVWKEQRLVLEYNSNKHHDTEEQRIMDFKKIAALQAMDIDCLPVEMEHFSDYYAFESIVYTIRKRLGLRARTGAESFQKRFATHGEILTTERSQRQMASLAETKRWQFIWGHL